MRATPHHDPPVLRNRSQAGTASHRASCNSISRGQGPTWANRANRFKRGQRPIWTNRANRFRVRLGHRPIRANRVRVRRGQRPIQANRANRFRLRWGHVHHPIRATGPTGNGIPAGTAGNSIPARSDEQSVPSRPTGHTATVRWCLLRQSHRPDSPLQPTIVYPDPHVGTPNI